MKKYVLTIDQGTTSSRAIVVDKMGNIVASCQKEITQIFPQSGWVEHDANEIWASQLSVILMALETGKIDVDSIAALGVTNQRETVVIWDRHTGQPIYNAIVWQDARTADFCKSLVKENKGNLIKEKTGLIVDAYFSASKIRWILNNVEGARKKAVDGDLIFGTIDTWLIWKLTEGQLHVTDVSNASRTMLFNINSLEWDEELIDLFEIPRNMFPTVASSSEIYGSTNIEELWDIPIAGIAGDQQAALFGQLCLSPGMVKNTYGTGCFMLMNTGKNLVQSSSGLLTTVAWSINGEVSYALEGSVFIGGAVVQWLRDGLKIIKSSGEVEQLAGTVNHSDGVYFVPAFVGLGAPYWNGNAKGTLFGITRGTTDAHIAVASLESIALQSMDLLEAMAKDASVTITELRVDGGAVVNNMMMQFQADVLDVKVIRPQLIESTAMGAAYLAGLAIGFWTSISEIQNIWRIDKTFYPKKNDENITKHKIGWKRAVASTQFWSDWKSEDL